MAKPSEKSPVMSTFLNEVFGRSDAIDFRVENHGSVWMFTPITLAAKKFLDENVASEGWMWFGNSLCVDHRPARAFAAYLQEEGFLCI